MTRDDLGERIRLLRKQAGITQKAAAKHAGVAALTWGSWENGRHQPHAYRIGAIANAIGTPVSALFTPPGTQALADVVVTTEALERAATQGASEVQALTFRIATNLAPIVASAAERHAANQGRKPIARRASRLISRQARASMDDSNTS